MNADTPVPSIEHINHQPAKIIRVIGFKNWLNGEATWISIVTAILVFSPLIEGGTTHVALMIIRLLILALSGVAIYQILLRGQITLVRESLAIPIILFLILASCSAAWSAYTHHSVHWLMVLAGYAIFLFLLVHFISQWEHMAFLVGTVVAMACVELLVGSLQFNNHDIRISGTFFNSNFFAGYLIPAWTVLLSYLSYQRIPQIQSVGRSLRTGISWIRIGLPTILFTLLSLAIIWTGSRGGLLAACIGASVVISIRFGLRGFFCFLGIGLLGLMLTSNPLKERIYVEHHFNPTTYARWEMWEGAKRMVLDHPFGVGLGLYQYNYPIYAFPVDSQIIRYGTVAQTPHSEYVQITAELGIVGLSLVCWGIYLLTRQVSNILHQRLSRFRRQLLVGAGGAIASLLAHAAVDSNLHEPALAILLIVFTAIILASRTLLATRTSSAITIKTTRRPLWTAISILGIGTLAVVVLRTGAAWLYYDAGNTLNRQGDFDGALKQYNTALSIDSGKALYHSAAAAASFHQFQYTGHLEEARTTIEHLKTATALNPLDGRLLGLLGQVYLRIASRTNPGQQERTQIFLLAEAAYRAAITREPFNAAYYWELSQILLALGKTQEGVKLIANVVEIEPNFLRAREWLSRWHLANNQLNLAWKQYQEIGDRQTRYRATTTTQAEKDLLATDADALHQTLLSSVQVR